MSLEAYRRPRLIVQRPSTTVHEAARAMESNHVGAVIVHERGSIVGIVTDRDLSVRVVGYCRDPNTTTLREVMTPDVATLPITADESSAVGLMQKRHIRRIPLVDEDGKLAGLVTADDLLVAETMRDTANREALSTVIRAQLEEPASLKPQGAMFPVEPARAGGAPKGQSVRERLANRHAARAEETMSTLLHRVQALTGLSKREDASAALELVLAGIVRRITPSEANNLISQLPSALHRRLLDLPAGPNKSITRESIEDDLVERLHLSKERCADLVCSVGVLLEQAVSAGEIEDVIGQLPRDMRTIFPAASHAPH